MRKASTTVAQRDMRLATVVWDDVADTATLTFEELAPVQGPGWQNGNWYPDSGAKITFTVPIKRSATVTNATGKSVSMVDGELVWTKYELVNGTWVDRGRINPDGTPYQA